MNALRKRIKSDPASWIISCGGVLAVLCALILWAAKERPAAPGMIAAVLSAALFVIGCMRFVPEWMAFRKQKDAPALSDAEPKHMCLAIAALAFAVEALLFGLVTLALSVRYGNGFTFRGAIEFWRSLDSAHYLDITREWYLSEGDWGRVVQLVFLPGYPLAVYPFYRILGSDIAAGLLVSAVSFPLACCMLYRLLRLDYAHGTSFRAAVMLLLLPGGFFFIAPMSESLYLLLALSSLYCFRKKRFLLAGVLGAYCAFTRTVGLLLIAPMVLEWVRMFPERNGGRKRWLIGLVSLLLIPCGFLAYMWINRTVSGNALQFLTYQHDHWSQGLGWFFNTASYQTSYLLDSIREGSRETALGLWLPNLLWHFGTLALFIVTAKKLRPSYSAWYIAYFVIAIGTTWLLSGPRYLLAMPAIAMMLAAVTEKRWQKIVAAAVLVPLSALYLLAFVWRWQVW